MNRFSIPCAAVLAVLGLNVTPRPAAAVQVAPAQESFSFVGTCADCVGTGTGNLVVQPTFAGQHVFSNNEFVSFDYSSSILSGPNAVHLTSIFLFNANFATLPGPNNVEIATDTFDFQSYATGFWCIGNACASDYGPQHVWSLNSTASVPEPISASLLGTAVLGLTFMRRRRTPSA